ncbi:hypothetical protein ES703_115092 [subsurface metagenome]
MDKFDLVLLRLRAGLKQYELAQLLGVPATSVCDLERGRRAITPELEKRIKQAINEGPNRKAIGSVKVGKLASTGRKSQALRNQQ